MNNQKRPLATLAGGITLFLLGYLFYGLLLADFFKQHTVSPIGSMKTMGEIVWWAMIVGNLAGGALLTYIFLKIGNILSFTSGVKTGAVIGLFMSLSLCLIAYSTQNNFDLTGMFTDVAVRALLNAIAGGVIAVVLRGGAKKA